MEQELQFQKDLVKKLAERLEFHEQKWRADTENLDNKTVELITTKAKLYQAENAFRQVSQIFSEWRDRHFTTIEQLTTRVEDLTNGKMFCSLCDELILDDNGESVNLNLGRGMQTKCIKCGPEHYTETHKDGTDSYCAKCNHWSSGVGW